MVDLKIGQRWISETEPELGLGVLESVTRHQLRLVFPASNEARIYAAANAPIKRVAFRVGDLVQSQQGASITIEAIDEADGLLTYRAGAIAIAEAELADTISFSKPEDRLINGQVDASATFSLRHEVLQQQRAARQSPVAGFMGGRIDLIPHQLYIAGEVAQRYLPRVLLADEVGLGKTIEACLIVHRLHLTGRANRVLIVLPESLVHQWFVELLRRFNLWFTLFDAERCEAIVSGEPDANPFLEEQLILCSLSTLVENERWADHATAAEWDMLVVDEAHHLEWSPTTVSPEYVLVEALTRKSQGLLLLTATPEQLGAEGHFARLRLLDPQRYPDLESFKQEQADYAKVAAMAEKLAAAQPLNATEMSVLRALFAELSDAAFARQVKDGKAMLADLVDRHGTGRVIFRNTREALQGFPQRQALPVELQPRKTLARDALQARLLNEFEQDIGAAEGVEPLDYRHGPRIKWLADLLRELGADQKLLLICQSKAKVLAIHEALADEMTVSAAVFHEGLTLLQRDRNAAWFAELEGARLLICSEIGSEGRNFQFAHHLVLFDLPLNPELLEQRIGRLDRIGQSQTIRIHIPYLEQSSTELLKRWHHDGLGTVEHSLRGGNAYLEKFGEAIRRLGRVYHEGDPERQREADALIEASRAFRQELEAKLSEGQDKLIALNSYRESAAKELVQSIHKSDTSRSLDDFMARIFDHFGVTVDDVDPRTYRLSPGQLFTDSFPCLPDEGTTITFERSKALGREDIGFLTWDHPMVRGAMDLMLSMEQGNSAMVVWEAAETDAPPLLIEAIYVLESVAPAQLHVDRFLPPTPVRVLVNLSGEDCREQYAQSYIDRHTRDEEAFRIQQNPELLQALVPQMLSAAREIARAEKSKLLERAMQEAHARLDGEARRLKELQKVNRNVSVEEVRLAEQVVEDVTRPIAKARLRLDAVRLILKNA